MSKVSGLTGRGVATIRRIIEKAGVTRTDIIPNKSRKVNDSYFTAIDSEQKAYWLGFLMADGCIANRRSGYRVLRINLSGKDSTHLGSFNTHIESDYPISTFISKSTKSHGKEHVRLHITCAAFAASLLNLGWDDFKKRGKWIEIDQCLMRHQLRGFMDGDGWVSTTKTSNPPVHVGFCSQFDSVLARICQIVGAQRSIYNVSTIRVVRFNGHICRHIHRLLYDGASIWLNRKRKRFEELLGS